MTFYWLFSGFFLIIDVTGKPAFVLKYKIQDDQNMPVNISSGEVFWLDESPNFQLMIPFKKLLKLEEFFFREADERLILDSPH